jgi:hypothetical protein
MFRLSKRGEVFYESGADVRGGMINAVVPRRSSTAHF